MEKVKRKSPLQICHRSGRRFRAQVCESHRTMRHQGYYELLVESNLIKDYLKE